MKISYKYAVALIAALGLFMAVLDNTIVNVALIPMANAFQTDINSIQWVVTAYFLAQAAIIPGAGYLSTRLGIKQIFIASLVLFTFCSLLCGLSDIVQDINGHPYIGLLIFFRVLQGIGGGALFPVATAMALSGFPPDERANASAVVGLPVLMAPSFGPTIGGLLIDSIGWQWIFFINIPFGILAIFLVARVYKPENEPQNPHKVGRFDFIGLVLSMLGIVGIVYGFNLVSQRQPGTGAAGVQAVTIYGWGYWEVWAWIGGGIVLLLAFVVYELRAKDPVVDLRLFKQRDFATASIMTWALRAFVIGALFMLQVFLQNIRYPHLNATAAGLATMPMGLASGLAVVLSGRKLYTLIGPRYLVLTGMVFLAGSNFLLLNLNNNTDGWSLLPAMVLWGIGFGMTGIPLQTIAMEKLKGFELPRASSLLNASAQIFSSIGIAVLTTFFIQQTSAHQPVPVTATQVATQLQQQMAPGFLLAHPGMSATTLQTSTEFQQQVEEAVAGKITSLAGIPALSDLYLLVAIGLAVMIFLSFILPDRRAKNVTGNNEGAASELRQPVLVE